MANYVTTKRKTFKRYKVKGLPPADSPLYENPPTQEQVDEWLRHYEALIKEAAKLENEVPPFARLYVRQRGRCALSNALMWPQATKRNPHPRHLATFDHIVPRSKGGTNEFSNFWLLCSWVNADRRNLDIETYAEAFGFISITSAFDANTTTTYSPLTLRPPRSSPLLEQWAAWPDVDGDDGS